MKHSEMLNLNLPEDNDLINVGHLSGNFEKIDSAFQILPIKQEESKTDIDVMACPPYWTMYNPTDEDIVYIDHNFLDEEFTLEAGQTITHEIEEPESIRISSDTTIDYTWFIPASEAFSGGGGGGGTSDYNKLNNLPTINNIEIKNNKTADDLGLVAKENGKGLSTNDFSDSYKSQLDGLDSALASKLDGGSVGVAGGVASLGNDGKVPSSQLPTPTAQKEYKIVEASAEGYAKSYKLQQKNGETWTDISDSVTINIPKDMVVESGSVKECTTDNVPVSGYKKGDKYIDLVIANKADAHIYINVKDLIDNKAEGIQYSNTTSKLTATNVQSAIDEIAEMLNGVKDSLDKKQNKTFIEAVDSETSVVTVPEGTSFAAVGKISGKTVKDGEVLKSAPVKSVVSSDVNGNKTTVSLSEIVKDLPDYGIEGNVLDLENMKYYHNRSKISINSSTFVGYYANKNCITSKSMQNVKGNNDFIMPIYTKQQDTSYTYWGDVRDKSVFYSPSEKYIVIRDTTYSSKDDFINAITGLELVYELATPEVIDLTSVLYPFKVELGGTITFENEHNLDVNNTVLYKKEVL